MKVWISKYALKDGIYEKDVMDCGNGDVKQDNFFPIYYHGDQAIKGL